MEKKPKKKDVSDFAGKASKPKDKSDFAGKNKILKKSKKDVSDFAGKKSGPRKDVSDFAGKASKPKDKSDFAGKNKGPKDLSDFSGKNKAPKNSKNSKTVPLPKPRPSSIKTKKKEKVALPKSRPSIIKTKVKIPKNVSQGSTTSTKTLGSMKPVSSLKTSRAGTDEAKGDNNKTPKKKLSFFDKIIRDTKKNFSGDFKKKTGRYKSISTGKTNFNKKK